jgi:hypothetical protein
MIIVKLQGGLGNQMFQYATGRSLAELKQTELKLDDTFLQDKTPKKDFTLRDYELDIFQLNTKIASRTEIDRFFNKPNGFVNKIVNRIKQQFIKYQVIKQRFFHFDETVLYCRKNTYLDGYWQSYRYFEPITGIIQKEFTMKSPMDNKNLTLARKIEATQSVAVHIRRGDYVKNEKTNQHHGVCSTKYYQEAIIKMVQKVDNPHFFFFSDDIEWVKDNLMVTYPSEYVNYNTGKKSYEDMRLMSLCKHNIIANSSFSWWGAWLNPHAEKMVIAPKKWFNDPNRNTSDLIPENWLRL